MLQFLFPPCGTVSCCGWVLAGVVEPLVGERLGCHFHLASYNQKNAGEDSVRKGHSLRSSKETAKGNATGMVSGLLVHQDKKINAFVLTLVHSTARG